MIKNIKSKLLLIFIGLLIATNGFWLYIAFQNKTFPYYQLGKHFLKIERSFKIILSDKKQYSEKIIDEHLSEFENEFNEVTYAKVETHLLPLNKKVENINKSVDFPLKGGSITPTNKGLLILDRLGRIYHYEKNVIVKTDLNVPNNLYNFISDYSGEKINLNADTLRAHSIQYDKENSIIYVSYSEFIEKEITRLSVSSIRVDKNDFSAIGDWTKLYETEAYYDLASNTSGAGGKILLHNNDLFLTVGNNYQKIIDGEIYISNDDDKSSSGKIIKINLLTGSSQYISRGHRNSQGLVILDSGMMLNTEHGPQGGDEINLIKKGKHYGYPYQTFGTDYGKYTYTPPKESKSIDFVDPIFDFSPAIGISSIIQVSGFHEKWNGSILVGSLKGRSLYRLVRSKENFISLESIWIGSRIRDMTILNDSIILLSDSGELILLNVDNEKYFSKNRSIEKNIDGLTKCLGCHSMSPISPKSLAPTLYKIYNKKIGSDSYANYSIALQKFEGKWDKESLSKYLSNPSKFIPGTSKVEIGLNEVEIKNIVEILSK